MPWRREGEEEMKVREEVEIRNRRRVWIADRKHSQSAQPRFGPSQREWAKEESERDRRVSEPSSPAAQRRPDRSRATHRH